MSKQRRQVYVVMNNRTIWKGLFFMKQEQALPAVMKFYGHGWKWKRAGKNKLTCDNSPSGGKTFTVKPIKEYTKVGDVPYSKNTSSMKGEKHP